MNSIGTMHGSLVGQLIESRLKSDTDPGEKFQNLDADGDGGLDRVELSEEAKMLSAMSGKTLDVADTITTYDADGDGLLSEEEMMTMVGDVLGPPPEQEVASAGMGGEMGSVVAMPPPGPPPQDLLVEYDDDEDGFLSEDELTVLASDFEEKTGQAIDVSDNLGVYDADDDGTLSQEEMDNMMIALQGLSGDPLNLPSLMRGSSNIQNALEAYIADSNDDEAVDLAAELLAKLSAE